MCTGGSARAAAPPSNFHDGRAQGRSAERGRDGAEVGAPRHRHLRVQRRPGLQAPRSHRQHRGGGEGDEWGVLVEERGRHPRP